MKNALLVLLLVLVCCSPASADTLIRFTDGNSIVWDNVYSRASEYCTQIEDGTFCVQKKDVVYVQRVADGTKSSEYGVSIGISDENSAARMKDFDVALSQSESIDRDLRVRRDREYQQDLKKRKQQEYKDQKRRLQGKSEFGD